MLRSSDEPVRSVRIPIEGQAYDPSTCRLRTYTARIDAEDEELVRILGPWELQGQAKLGYHDWRSHTPRAYTLGSMEGVHPDELFRHRIGAPRLYLHDLIMGVGAGEEAFPANGDGLDCRKSNLRLRKVKPRP